MNLKKLIKLKSLYMKLKIISLTILVFCLTSCNSGEKYDFGTIHSTEDYNALLAEMRNNGIEIDSSFLYKELTLKGMFYNDVPISKAILNDAEITLHTDTINFSAKKILESIETHKGFGSYSKGYSISKNEFKWDNEQENLKLNLNLAAGNNLAKIGERDTATLDITFNQTYDIPLANIHKEIKVFKNEPNYMLNISNYGCNYKVFLNKIRIDNDYYLVSINRFILNDTPISLKIIISPIKGNTFMKDHSFKAKLINTTTEEVIASVGSTTYNNIEKTRGTTYYSMISSLYRKKKEHFEINFTPKLNIPKAWSNGIDLRNNKDLKRKVSALYKKIGELVLAKDEQGINNLLYTMVLEENQSIQNTDYNFFVENWIRWLACFNSTYKYTISQNFKIEYNNTGKLIKAKALDRNNMLVLTGKKFSSAHDYYLFQPKNSSELKIIRQ